ncbi:FkbM family methyltransferase [uncultured Brevundimonas sp.]|uniref:FkbM family methyltransferase n=1 Tax=uncultured Brevundimonas sp. TaxID=213418 RepID=UPI002612560C|nr:FkbM family methyltransferase [uncultured Brevundimonas sp.]
MNSRFLWRAWRARLADQAMELSLIRRHTGPGDLACDVGANKGSYLYWMARWSGRVVAFEPQPGLAAYLQAVAAGLPMNNVMVEQAGVSDRAGELALYVPSVNSPEASLLPIEGAATVTVPVVALDDYFTPGERLRMLKVDVEGAELDVFRGAERILREDRPVILFECEQRHLRTGSVSDCFRHLEARGYAGRFIHGRALKPVSAFDAAVHQSQAGDRFWRAPGYCNNFLFVPG